MLKYYTMVSDMDKQIGMVLDHIDKLGIAKDTLILFASDNGPEVDAGTSGGLRDRKRSIYEGGIRVPAIVQWEGTIPSGSVVNSMATSTDAFPTFLDAAGIVMPERYRIDGSSILPDLLTASRLPAIYSKSGKQGTHESELSQVELAAWCLSNNIPTNKTSPMSSNSLGLPQDAHPLLFAPLQAHDKSIAIATHTDGGSGVGNSLPNSHHPVGNPRRRSVRRQLSQERLFLWHADFESPRRTAAIAYGYKIVLDENDVPMEMFDLSFDPREQQNLLPIPTNFPNAKEFWSQFSQSWPNTPRAVFKGDSLQPSQSTLQSFSKFVSSLTGSNSHSSANSAHNDAEWLRWHIFHRRQHPEILYQVLYHLFPAMRAFATHGSDGYQQYMKQYPELRYPSTPISYERPMITNVYKTISRDRMDSFVRDFLKNNLCKVAATCSCDIPLAKDVPPLPYPETIGDDAVASTIAIPHGYVNASVLLFDNWF
jgi:hypothetical protein